LPDSVIPYDRKLPFNPEANPYREPRSYLVKDGDTYKVISGRRPSKLLLVDKLRDAVRKWRDSNYETPTGATETTKELLRYWFEEDHLVEGQEFNYYFCQRESIETIVYLVEVERFTDLVPLFEKYTTQQKSGLFDEDLIIETPDGRRAVRAYVPEREAERVQDLPERNLLRYAVKMATGSGKTVVIALVMVWSYLNRMREKRPEYADNFLLIAPNLIVLERLEKDFRDNAIFRRLNMIPPYLNAQWNLKVITRGDSSIPRPSGNLFLQNIQQLYEKSEERWTPLNAVEAFLGKPAKRDVDTTNVSVLQQVKKVRNLLVMNDEAHHVHDEDLQWHKTLINLHHTIPDGLKLWLDFSATPRDQNGTAFPWIVEDYPLAQAVEDAIVKAPIIAEPVKKEDPRVVTRENVTRVYHPWIQAAVERWKEHNSYYKKLGKQPVLFIMAERNDFADEIGKSIRRTWHLDEDEVLVIHTDNKGQVVKSQEEDLRIKAREIDSPESKVKVIVSVLMLREGWDVQNVTIALGLRPYTAEAKILPEQAVGRGLRIITGISTDSRQTLEVIGTKEFENFVRKLEVEGVGISTFDSPPPLPIQIEPIKSRITYDIEIPETNLIYSHNYKLISSLDPLKLDSLEQSKLVSDARKIVLTMEFATTATYLGTVRIDPAEIPTSNELLSYITGEVIKRAALTGANFSELYPFVKRYVSEKCFGETIDIEDNKVRNRLADPDVQNAIISLVAKVVGNASVMKDPITLKSSKIRLSDTAPFVWRRKHLTCKRTIFNYVATYNQFESNFAEFLDAAPDIERFASFAERNVKFKIDYIASRGAIRFYYPDFVAVQKTGKEYVNWIIETKGQEWEDTDKKDAAMESWCREVSRMTGNTWRYIKVLQEIFDKHTYYDFSELVKYVWKSK
jgi:type III restriction enzyme